MCLQKVIKGKAISSCHEVDYTIQVTQEELPKGNVLHKKNQTNHTKFRPCNCDALSGSTGVNTMSIQHTYLLRAAINYPHEKAALPDFNDKV